MGEKILLGPEAIIVYQAFYPWNKEQFINERRMALGLKSGDEVPLDQIPSIITGRGLNLPQLGEENPWPFMRFFEYSTEAGDFGWGKGFLNITEIIEGLIKKIRSNDSFLTEYHLENLLLQRENPSALSTQWSMNSSQVGLYLPLHRYHFGKIKSAVEQEFSK